MDKDTPRYGSRDEDDSQRNPDESPFDDERTERRGFMPPRYSDDENGAGSTRKSAGSYGRPEDEPTSSYRSRLSSLDGLRSSKYGSDDLATPDRDSYSSSLPRDTDNYQSDDGFDTDRPRYRSRLSSTFGDRDKAPRNPLLRSDPSERKFSWEQDTPSALTRSQPDRETDNSRYGSSRSRLDELTARRAERAPRPGFGSDDVDDTGRYDAAARPPPLIRPPGRDSEYQAEPPPRHRDSYFPAEQEPDYDAYEEGPYQGAHARELADVDDRYAREYQYDADGGELRQNYGDFDQDFPQYDQPYEERPQKRRRGPFLLLGSLVGVAVIAGGLIFVYQQGLREGQTDTVPVITADEQQIKVKPVEPGGNNISQKTKLIYDRIIGEDTQSSDTIVPREEQPLTPSDQNQSNNAPEADTNTAAAVPAAESEPANTNLNGSEPLPLPLPPPPSGIQELVVATQAEEQSPEVPLGTGGQIVAPTGLEVTNEPPAPASQETLTVAEPAKPLQAPQPAEQPEELAQLITSPPLPKDKPVPPSRRAEPGVAVPTGPIQIAPLPGSVARSVTPTDQTTVEQASPTQLQTPTATPTQPTQRRVVSNRFEEELTSGVATSFTQQNSQVAAVDTQVQAPAPAAPQVETPAAVPTETPITGGRYLVQLGAFRSEAEAQSEFQNLRGRHPGLLASYTSLVQQADLGATGVYYRLRIGPIETKSNASQLCNSLIAAGERDCLVRQR